MGPTARPSWATSLLGAGDGCRVLSVDGRELKCRYRLLHAICQWLWRMLLVSGREEEQENGSPSVMEAWTAGRQVIFLVSSVHCIGCGVTFMSLGPFWSTVLLGVTDHADFSQQPSALSNWCKLHALPRAPLSMAGVSSVDGHGFGQRRVVEEQRSGANCAPIAGRFFPRLRWRPRRALFRSSW